MGKLLPEIVGFFLNILSFFSSRSAAKIALKLFSIPRKGQITKEQAAFLETASKAVFQYKNQNIMTYNWHGNNKTILLIHGWESNAARWVDLINDLQKKNFNIVAIDAPAHGNSGSPLFNVVLYADFIHVIAKSCHPNMIIAHSLGGLSATFSISKNRIQNIQKLILVGAPSEFTDVIKRYTHMMGYNNRIIFQLNKIITERFGLPPASLSTAQNLKNLDADGLIIHDEGDDIIPYSDAIHIKNSFENSTLITTKGLGHSLKDKSVNSQIVEFIQS